MVGVASLLLSAFCLLPSDLSSGAPRPTEWRKERIIGPGVRYTRVYRSTGPCSIQIVEADTSDPLIHVGTSLPVRRIVGAARLSTQAGLLANSERYPIAAVNGDYFIPNQGRYHGVPIGACIVDREIIHSPYPRSALIVDRNGGARIEILRMQGAVIRPDGEQLSIRSVNHPRERNGLVVYTSRFGSSTRTSTAGTELILAPESLPVRCGEHNTAVVREVRRGIGNAPIPAEGLVLSAGGTMAALLAGVEVGEQIGFRLDLSPELSDAQEVIGGGPRLVRDGRAAVEDEANVVARTGGRYRHPRTLVGIRGRSVFMVTVDGRRPGYSVGMTLWEAARLMQSLGCTDAMALDGGGSTTMWVRGSVNNRPSGGRERAVSNGLMVFSTAPHGPASRLLITPTQTSLLPGAASGVRISAEDRHYNPVTVDPVSVDWSFDPPILKKDERGRLIAAWPDGASNDRLYQDVRGTARVGEGTAEVRFRVYSRPHRLVVSPAAANLKPGQSVRFAVTPLDEVGRVLPAPAGSVQWNCPTTLAACDAAGLLRAGSGPTAGWVTVSLNKTTCRVPVTVGTVSRPLTDLADGISWRHVAVPAGTRSATEIVKEAPEGVDRALRMRYTFASRGGTRAIYAQTRLALGNAVGIRLLVQGDGSGASLKAKVRDGVGRVHVLTLCPRVSWKQSWRELAAAVPPGAKSPTLLESVYLVQPGAPAPARGVVLFANIRGEYRPPFPTPVSSPAPPLR